MLVAISTFGPWAICAAIVAVAYRFADRQWTFTGSHVVVFALIWVAIVQAEGIFPGPLSRLEWGDGDRLFIGYFGWLAKQGNAAFLPELAGGVDRYAFGRIGGEFFSIRLLLLQVMPLWAVTVLIRIAVTLSSIAGIYLFAHRILGCPRGVAFAFGMLYATAYEFTVTLTFLYAFSIAGLPLLLYALFAFRNDLRGWSALFIVGALYIGTSDPIYWLPLLWACVICLLLWIRPASVWLTLGGLVLLSLLWLANYAETLFGFLQMLPWSERGAGGGRQAQGFLAELAEQIDYMFRPVLSFNYAGVPFGAPLIFALVTSLMLRSWRIALATATTLVLALATVVLERLPWAALGVPFLTTYRWYLYYGSFGMSLLAGAAAVAALRGRNCEPKVTRWAVSLAVGVAFAVTLTVKIQSVLQTLTRGSFAALTNIPNLANADWFKTPGSRVVSLPTLLDPNAAVNYGFATFDGAATLVDHNVHHFWSQGVMRGVNTPSREILGFGLAPEFKDCCQPLEIGAFANLNLLRLAGVGYVLSYRRLESPDLSQVSGPSEQDSTHSMRFLFASPRPVFVYRLSEPLPLAWRPTKLTVLSEPVDDATLFNALETHALNGEAIVVSSDRQASPQASATLPVDARWQGSTMFIDTHGAGGAILVNQSWLPWWSAVTDSGAAVPVRPANLIHMLLDVPEGARIVRLEYRRPLFWAQVLGLAKKLFSTSAEGRATTGG